MLSKILYAGVGAVVTAGTITAINSCSSKDTPIVNNYYDNSVSVAVLSENSDLTGEQVVEIVNGTMDKKTVQKSADCYSCICRQRCLALLAQNSTLVDNTILSPLNL